MSEKTEEDKKDSFKVPLAPVDVKSSLIKSKKPSSVSQSVDDVDYESPSWSTTPPAEVTFKLTEIKNGVIVKELSLNKPYYIIGRKTGSDIVLSHESVSRTHAVLQYGSPTGKPEDNKYYMYDFGSSNGTFINKQRINVKTYTALNGGYVFKFAFSTRIFTLDVWDPSAECEADESNVSSSEEGVDWGQKDDATETSDPCPDSNYFASGLQFNDPVKALKGWFSDELKNPDFKLTPEGPDDRVWRCCIELPLKESLGNSVESDHVATGIGKSKEEAMKYAANDACLELARCGFPISRYDRPTEKDWEKDDYYSSDEDPFFDQTGELEKKREMRKKRVSKSKHKEGYEKRSRM